MICIPPATILLPLNLTERDSSPSAISYVTSDETLTVYQLTGHEEQSLGSNFTDAIEKNNISLEDLSLVTMDSVPEDAAALIINAPAKDFFL